MHQIPRQGPRAASPASSPTTNPMRTNNPREPPRPAGHSRTGSEALAQPPPTAAAAEESADMGPSRESIKKLDQIIQVDSQSPGGGCCPS